MARTVLLAQIFNNPNSVPPLALNLSQTAPIYRVALTSGQLALIGGGGAGGYTYSATGLPAGLSLNTATGSITGTPTTIGHNIVTATVTDSATNTFTTTFSVDVLARLSIAGAFQPVAEIGAPVSNQLAVVGATGTVTWSISASAYPGGAVAFNTSTAVLSGTPTSAGSWSGTVTASDSGTGESVTYTFVQTIIPAVTISPVAAIKTTVNVSVSTPIACVGGVAPFSWTVVRTSGFSDTIASIKSDGANGAILTILAKGDGPGSYAITVTDALGATASQNAALLVYIANAIIQPQKSLVNIGAAGPKNINFEFPSSGTPDVANDGTTMTVTIPTVAGATGPSGHGSTTTTAAPSASGGNWIFTLADTTAFSALGLPIYCSDGTNSIRGHVVSVASSTQLTVAPDSTSGTVSSIANGSTFTFSGVQGPADATGYSEGTSFPVSPTTDDKFYRTDLNYLCYYDGTRWLTCEEFVLAITMQQSIVPISSAVAGIAFAPVQTDHQLYLTNLHISTYVSTTNNASNYWTVTFSWGTGASVYTTIATFNTSGDAVSTITDHRTAVNASISNTAKLFRIGAAPTGSPGTFIVFPAISYRLIIT